MSKVFSPNEIHALWDKYIEVNNTPEYLNRYIPLPVYKNNKFWKWEGKDFPRVISLLEFERFVEKYNFDIDKLLVFNNTTDPEIEYLRFKQMHVADYDKNPVQADLHQLDLPYKDYDFVCLHQTLEHIYNPHQCLHNVKDHMRKDGYLYINVPACNAPHSEPFHYFMGYTPMGLATICASVGFKLLEVGQWGNEEYLVKLWTRQPGWSEYRQLQNPGLNQFQNPVITWALVQKL